MFYNAKNLTLKIDNTTMDYVSFGNGNKPLVLIPGLNLKGIKGAAFPLAYMYRIFTKEYTVYIFDRKENIPEKYTSRDIAKDTAYAMKMLKISNADIIGVSQGGMIAQYIAIDYPELVHKIVLAVTLSKKNETVEKVVKSWIDMAERNDYKSIIYSMPEKMYSEKYIKKYKCMFPIMTIFEKPKNLSRFIILAKACLTCDTYDKLHKIKCPVFVIGGKQDKVVTGKASEEIAEKLNCDIYMYDNLGHAAYQEAKDFNYKIFEFLHK